jgi:signal transduction histidine kinase/FixJ family two-component response regulator/HPt (histidine-containing phosphotransfer) domain-containing protein
MRRLFGKFIDRYFNKTLHFRVRLFNFLALGGITISLIGSIMAALNNESPFSIAMYFIGAPFSFALMHYASKTGNYERCYIITILAVFFTLFPIIFFTGGAYHGAMPTIFIFALLFTHFMLDGKKAIAMSLSELVLYIGISVYTYYHPESYTAFATDGAEFWDTMVGFALSGIALCAVTMFHFKLYNEQQRELEAAKLSAEKFSEAKSTFLANMSHEIRTPINVILGLNEMIFRESNKVEISEYSTGIKNAGKTLLSLISNILDMSKIEAGKLSPLTENYKTAKLIDELSLFGAELTHKKGLSFQIEVDDNLPQKLAGDDEHIKQIVLNLLGNAAKYTEEGGVVLYVGFKESDTDDKILLQIKVRDTGVGIKSEDQSVLFETFTRVDPAVTGSIEGAGLGLSISKELAQMLCGQIFVESVYGEGSTFTVLIPQQVVDSAPIFSARDSCSDRNEHISGSFIAPNAAVLVVDDNEDNLKVLRLLLSKTLINFDTAKTGKICLEAVGKKHYDAIIMDYMMPGMDGIETLRKLREIEGFNTPVIALTADVSTESEEKLGSAGFSNCLSKPVSRSELEEALIKIIPSELITPHITEQSEKLHIDHEAVKVLESYGISYSDGLAFLSGDVGQYIKIASLFIENAERSKKTFKNLAEKGGFSQLLYEAHSFKSRARAIGANSLSDTAEKLENLCALSDERHIKLLMPVLFYEWEKADEGLKVLVLTGGNFITPESEETAVSVNLSELMPLLKYNRQPDALELIEKLLAADLSPETENTLNKIRDMVNDVEFREAESLLIDLIGEGSDERQKIYSYS